MKRRKRDTSHVKLLNGPDGTCHRVRCEHCGGEATIVLPLEVSVWIATTRAFIKAHADCKVPQ